MSEKIKRNDPCPCGSGKKYKQCCLKNVSQPTSGQVGRSLKGRVKLPVVTPKDPVNPPVAEEAVDLIRRAYEEKTNSTTSEEF